MHFGKAGRDDVPNTLLEHIGLPIPQMLSEEAQATSAAAAAATPQTTSPILLGKTPAFSFSNPLMPLLAAAAATAAALSNCSSSLATQRARSSSSPTSLLEQKE